MKRLTAATMLTAVLLLTACNLRQSTELPPALSQEQIIATAVAATSQAMPAAPSDTPVPPAPDTPTPAPPTPTLPPTSTPTSTAVPIPCNKAEFVTDVSIPDGTDITVFNTFTKTWRLRNVGTCTWTSDYRVVFDHGDQMLAPNSAPITSGTVPPGSTVDVSVPMEAPGTPGTYKGYWKLRGPDGVLFGVGASGNVAFWVEIDSISNAPPGPNFQVAYENVHTCGSLPYATFWVANSGGVGFESAQIEIRDLNTSTSIYGPASNNAPFLGTASMCPPDSSSMGPGSVYFIAVSIGSSPPHGHNARLTLKLCTQDNLGGDCVTKTLDFVIP